MPAASLAVTTALAACGVAGASTARSAGSPSAASGSAPALSASTTIAGSAGPSVSAGPHRLIVTAPGEVPAHQHFFITVDVNFPLLIRIPMGVIIPGTGHFHFFIDRPPYPPGVHTPDIGLPGIIHSITERTVIPGLDPGTHTITVVLANGLDETSSEVTPVSVTVIVR